MAEAAKSSSRRKLGITALNDMHLSQKTWLCSSWTMALPSWISAHNIGGHNELKSIDIVKIICKALGKPEALITYVTGWKSQDMRYAIDLTKIYNKKMCGNR